MTFDDELDLIISVACDLLGLTEGDLFAPKKRAPRCVVAKEAIILMIRKRGSASFPQIAARFGCRNHSTIITAYQRGLAKLKTKEPVIEIETGELTMRQLVERIRSVVNEAVAA